MSSTQTQEQIGITTPITKGSLSPPSVMINRAHTGTTTRYAFGSQGKLGEKTTQAPMSPDPEHFYQKNAGSNTTSTPNLNPHDRNSPEFTAFLAALTTSAANTPRVPTLELPEAGPSTAAPPLCVGRSRPRTRPQTSAAPVQAVPEADSTPASIPAPPSQKPLLCNQIDIRHINQPDAPLPTQADLPAPTQPAPPPHRLHQHPTMDPEQIMQALAALTNGLATLTTNVNWFI